MAEKSPALTALAGDWRELLFPEASDRQFADGHAQAVTFGLLMARSSIIRLADGLDRVGKQLGQTNSLIGAALRLLTDEVGNKATLKTSLGALVRVLDGVDWQTVTKGKADAWLYFYEDILAVYDNKLRKFTGSFYTPPEVVRPMIRLVDDVLRAHFDRSAGLAAPDLTLADPAVGTGTFVLGVLRRIAAEVESDQGAGAVPQANEVKRTERITVVIGNPPYKEKAKCRGGWIEEGTDEAARVALLGRWIPPKDWGVGAHAKHLRNLYVYSWRWATWKVFDHDPQNDTGIVCFITVAGFLNGPGFQKMRDYLRRTCDRIWVIDCTPEGHQPDVPTRIFQAVQQPVCIVLAARSKQKAADEPATVKYTVLPAGKREEKFAALAKIKLRSKVWQECPTDWRGPFLPAATGDWASYPAIDELFAYSGSGVMPGRTWINAPDAKSLCDRWRRLTRAKQKQKESLFHPHLRGGEPGDKHVNNVVKSLPGYADNPKPVADEKGE